MRFGKTEVVTIICIILVIAVVGVYAYLTSKEAARQNSAAGQALGDRDTGAIYTDTEGEEFSLEQYEGKVRVVNAWATWCPFCIEELPDFAAVAAEYSDDEVVFIAINRMEQKAKVKAYIERLGLSDQLIFVQDPNDTFYTSIGGFSMPETVFYDAAGNISYHKRGFMTAEEIRERTETARNATD